MAEPLSDVERLKRCVCDEIDRRGGAAIDAARRILENAETGFREVRTARLVAEHFRALGLQPREGLAVTGVVARLDGGRAGPNVAIMGELDSLIAPNHPHASPDSGAAHACGHHCQIGNMLAAAMGLKAEGVLGELSGSVTLIAVPAEEYIEIEWRDGLRREGRIEFLGGKPELIRLGELDGVDIAMMTHTTPHGDGARFRFGSRNTGTLAKLIRFSGVSAHAGLSPHLGVNALNAAHIALGAIHAQRETYRDDDAVRIHPIVTRGGEAVNAVPTDVRLETFVRATTTDAMMDANAKVDRALRAGALAVGGSVTVITLPGYLPLRQDTALVDLHARNAELVAGKGNVKRLDFGSGSTDMGDVSHLMPAIHPYVAGATGRAHGDDMVIEDYELAVLDAGKVMAATVVDLLANDASEGRRIIDAFKPAMTRAQYLAHQRRLLQERTYTE